MRIIITPEGVKEISPLQDELNHSPMKVQYSPNMNSSSSLLFSNNNMKKTRSISTLINAKTSNLQSSRSLFPLTSKNTIARTGSQNNFFKKIKITPKKLLIPKEQSELYDNDKTAESHIVRQTNDILSPLESKKVQFNQDSLPKLQNSYSLKEIINEDCFKQLNKKLIQDKFDSTHDILFDNKNFTNLREDSKRNNIFDKVEKEKNTKIDCTHSSLIEYLINRKKVSVGMLNILSSYNEDKMYKLNKICQRILVDTKEEKNILDDIKNKIINDKIKEKEYFRKKLNSMNKELKDSKKTIQDFKYKKLKDSHKLIFKEIHKDFKKKYWITNNNFKRFFYSRNSQSVKNGTVGANFFNCNTSLSSLSYK